MNNLETGAMPGRSSSNVTDAPKSPEMDTAIDRLCQVARNMAELRQRLEGARSRMVGARLREAKKEDGAKAPTPGHHMARLRGTIEYLETLAAEMNFELNELENAI
jgi:hypothetical protein